MSVVGLDVGNENCIVGVARQRGIDVVLNDESSRETPAMVSFSEKQRFIGTAAASTATMNPKNTISQIKRLIGRKFRDPEVQKDLHLLPFNVSEGRDGGPMINVQYLNERNSFTPTQILGMILRNLKSIAEKALGASVVDCVIGIPTFFSELQRRAYLDAAAIAGLHPLRLMHETTATALAYGIYKPDLPENEPVNVVFVDIGHGSMQVCVAAFKKGQLKILGQAFDRSLGGRDFDEVLFRHFVEKFKQEYNIDVSTSIRASQRLRAACEKLKKILSANAVAPLNIECLMDEKDVKSSITREEFEHLAAPLLERVKTPCEKALADSNLTLDKIGAIEVIGSGSRVPAVLKIIASYFQREPSRTLNASECIARGCTLQCAMLSPTFRVRDFEVQDSFPFAIALSWKGPASLYGDGGEPDPTSIVFVKGNPIPSAKLLTFHRSGTFSIDALYADVADLPPGTPPKISTYQIGPFSPSKPDKATLKVKIRLNIHGILSLELATLVEEDESVMLGTKSAQESVESSPMDSDRAGRPIDGRDPQDADSFRASEQTFGGAENAAPSPDNKSNNLKMEAETTQPEVVKKRKTKRTDVPVSETVFGGFLPHELQKAVEKEYDMALQDRVMEETKEKKNAVEAYVYEMRNKLSERLQEFATEREREDLATMLQQTEFWLYEEGEDESKGVYVAKLAELKKIGDPLVERHKEDEERGLAAGELLNCIASYRDAVQSKDAEYEHILLPEREKVALECKKAEEWLKAKKLSQDAVGKTATPALLAVDIRKRLEAVEKVCKPIITKARPPPSRLSTTATGDQKAAERPDSHCGSSNVPTTAPDDLATSGCTDSDRSRTEGEMMQTE